VSRRVRVVVLNYDGGEMTLRCLDSLRGLDWPQADLDVVLVDNGSVDGIAERVRADYADVTLLEPLANLGFAGGCNLGIGDPAAGLYDYVALLNNDAIAEPGWLAPLVAALDADPGLGAASSKMLFADRYWGVRIDAPLTAARGARVAGLEVDGRAAWAVATFDEGFAGAEAPQPGEPGARWTIKPAELRVLAAPGEHPKRMAVRLSAATPRTVTLSTGGDRRSVVIGPEPAWVELDLPEAPHDVVNNAGSNLYEGGYGGDRGFLERDEGQYDEPAEVFAWCGGAVLLRPAYLQRVGLLDERFFLYYEDTDLSWRGRLQGWRYGYAPQSVVRHLHAATSGEGSETFRYFVGRNRLLMLAKNAPPRVAVRAGLVEAKVAAEAVAREYVRPLARGHRPRCDVAPQKVRSLRSVAKHVPAMVADRRRAAAARRVSDADIMAWTVRK
jgi:GT2 family glycosyltransferase